MTQSDLLLHFIRVIKQQRDSQRKRTFMQHLAMSQLHTVKVLPQNTFFNRIIMTCMRQFKCTAGLFLTSVWVFTSLTGLHWNKNTKIKRFLSCIVRNTNTISDHN